MKSLLTINYLILCSPILIAGGINPRYHGNGIWTSESQNSGLNVVLILAGILLIILFSILVVNNHNKIKNGAYSIITGVFGLIIIAIVVLFEFFVKALLGMLFIGFLPDRGYLPQWLGGLLGLAIIITIPRSFILRELKK